jgi:Tol biopolymer transport system component
MKRSIVLILTVHLAMVAGDAAAWQWSDWGVAEPVTEINTPTAGEGCAIESPDGRKLYLASNRPGGLGGNDIWVTKRENRQQPWGELANLGAPVNSSANDFCPTPLPGKWLFFVSERPGPNTCNAGPGKGDMYLIRKNPAHGWGEPLHLGCIENDTGPNSIGAEFSPSFVETSAGAFLYFSSDIDGVPPGEHDIYMSEVGEDWSFGPPTRVAELSTEFDDRYANVTKDGLEIVFSSNRPGGAGGFDVWYSSRNSVSEPWSAPVNLGANINTADPETRPTFSWNRKCLYFGRVTSGNGDTFVSTRSKVKGKP